MWFAICGSERVARAPGQAFVMGQKPREKRCPWQRTAPWIEKKWRSSVVNEVSADESKAISNEDEEEVDENLDQSLEGSRQILCRGIRAGMKSMPIEARIIELDISDIFAMI